MFNRTSSKRETVIIASPNSPFPIAKQIQAASLSLASANSSRGITRREAINRTSTSSRSTIGRSLSLGRRGILAALNGEEVAPQSPSNGGRTSFMKVFSTKLSGPPLKTTASTTHRTKSNQTKLEHSEVSLGAATAAIKTAERANHHRRSSSRQHEFRGRSSGRRLSHSYATLTTASLSSSSHGSFSSGSRSISPPRRRARSKSRPMSPSPYQRSANRQPTLSPPPRRPLSLHRNKGIGEIRSRKRSVTPSPRSSGSRRVEDVLPPRSREQPLQGRSRKVEGDGEGERSSRRRRSPPPAPPPGYLNWRKGDANRRHQNDTAMRQVSPLLRRSVSNGRSLPSMSRLPPPPPFCLPRDERSPPNKASTVFRRHHSDSFPVNGGAGAPKSRGDKGVVQRRHSAEGKLGRGIMTLPPPSPPPRTQSRVLRSQYAYKQLLAMTTAKRDVGSGSVASQEFEVSDEKSKTSDSEESPRSLTNWVHKRCSDINGFTGKYIGEVNSEGLMHGFGIMFYDFGLQHDGIWVNGLWEEATHDAANWNLTGQSSLGTSDRSSRDSASMVSSLSPSIKQIQMNHMMVMQRQLRSTVQGVGCPLTPPPKQIIVPGQQHQGEVQTQDESNGMNQFKRQFSLEGSPEVQLPLKPPAPVVEQDNRPPPLTEIKVKVKMPPPPPPKQQQEHYSSNRASSVRVPPPPPPPKLETMSSIHEKGQDNCSSPIADVRVVQVPPPPKRTTKESSSTDDQEQEDGEDILEEATYDNIMMAATKWLVRAKRIDQEEGEYVDIPKEVTYDNLERAKKWLSRSKQMDQEEEQDDGIPEDVTYNSLVLAAAAMTDTGMVQSVCSGTLTRNSLLSGQSGSRG